MTVDSPITRADQWMFGLGAVFTSSIACLLLAAPSWSLELFYRRPMLPEDPVLLMVGKDFAGSLLLFGIGYAIVALNPAKNHAVVGLGIAGKACVVVAMTQRFIVGAATGWILIAVAGDLLFGLLFARFLWRTR